MAQTSSSRSCAEPRRHAGIFESVLDNPEQFIGFQFGTLGAEVGRFGQHRVNDRIGRPSRRAMAGRAATLKVPRSAFRQRRVVKLRHVDAQRMGTDRTAHTEFENEAEARPVPPACRDAVEARPGKQKAATARKHGEASGEPFHRFSKGQETSRRLIWWQSPHRDRLKSHRANSTIAAAT